MPYRTFADSTGVEWQVWDIVPQLTERRESHDQERRRGNEPIAFADRRRDTRRLTLSRRAVLRGSFAQGWLCFDNGVLKRRLTPIPADWTTCSEELIEVYMRHAERVTGPYRAISDVSSDAPIAEAG
jgi:hypothetical protein